MSILLNIKKIKKDYLDDRAIFYSLLGTVLRILFAPISLLLVSFKLTPELQGFYYLFFSIAGLQAIAEIGFSHTLVQGISHEMSYVSFNNKTFKGETDSIFRIEETIKLGFMWFSILSAICLFIVYPVGMFIMYPKADSSVWLLPWTVFMLFFSINLCSYPVNFFFEGVLQLERIYKTRFYTQLLTTFVFALLLFFDFGLFCAIASAVSSFLVNFTVLYYPYRGFFNKYVFKIPSRKFVKSILGWQLKVGFVWSTGYLYWQLPTVVIFSCLGPVLSGQFSMTINIINSITGLGQIFVKTKAAILGEMRAAKKIEEAQKLYKKSCRMSYHTVFISFIVFFVFWLIFPNFVVFGRTMSIIQTLILSAVFFINQITLNQAMYARCMKDEPFMRLSIFVNFAFPVILLTSLFFCNNLWGVILSFSILHIIELVWGYKIYNRVLINESNCLSN